MEEEIDNNQLKMNHVNSPSSSDAHLFHFTTHKGGMDIKQLEKQQVIVIT